MQKLLKTLLVSATLSYTPFILAAEQNCDAYLQDISYEYHNQDIILKYPSHKDCYQQLAKNGNHLAQYINLPHIDQSNINQYIDLAEEELAIAQFRLFNYYIHQHQIDNAKTWIDRLFNNPNLPPKFKQALNNIAIQQMIQSKNHKDAIYWNNKIKNMPEYSKTLMRQDALLQAQFDLMMKSLTDYEKNDQQKNGQYWAKEVNNNQALKQNISIQKKVLKLYQKIANYYSQKASFDKTKLKEWLHTIDSLPIFSANIYTQIPNIYIDGINDYALVNSENYFNRFKIWVNALANSQYLSPQDLNAQNTLLKAEYKIIQYYATQTPLNNDELKLWINKIESNPTLSQHPKIQQELFNLYFKLAKDFSIIPNQNIAAISYYLNLITPQRITVKAQEPLIQDSAQLINKILKTKYFEISLPWVNFLVKNNLITFNNIHQYFNWCFNIAQHAFANDDPNIGNLALQQVNSFEQFPFIIKQKNNSQRVNNLLQYGAKKYSSFIINNLQAKKIPLAENYFIQLMNSPFITAIPDQDLLNWFDTFVHFHLKYDNKNQPIEFYIEQILSNPYLSEPMRQTLLNQYIALLSANKKLALLSTNTKLNDIAKAKLLNQYINALPTNNEKIAFINNSIIGTPLAKFNGFSAQSILKKLEAENQQKQAVKVKEQIPSINTKAVKITIHTTKNITKYTLTTDFLFGFNKANLTPEGIIAVDEVAKKLISVQAKKVLVAGFTDDIGNDQYNLVLSQKRADAVKIRLKQDGVKAKIETIGYGEAKPVKVCSNHLSQQALITCLAPNRRVEISSYGLLQSNNKVKAGDGLKLETVPVKQ